MSFTVTGDATVPFVDAFKGKVVANLARLAGDGATWRAVTGVFGHLSETARTAYPYVVLGRRSRLGDGGAMQTAGGRQTLLVDVWSDAKGPFEASRICSELFAICERQPLAVRGFELVRGSLTCEFSEVFDEPDEDKPGSRLYHGVQRWIADVHEAR